MCKTDGENKYLFTFVCDLLQVAATGCLWELCSKNHQMNLWVMGREKLKGLGRGIELLVLHRIIKFEKRPQRSNPTCDNTMHLKQYCEVLSLLSL